MPTFDELSKDIAIIKELSLWEKGTIQEELPIVQIIRSIWIAVRSKLSPDGRDIPLTMSRIHAGRTLGPHIFIEKTEESTLFAIEMCLSVHDLSTKIVVGLLRKGPGLKEFTWCLRIGDTLSPPLNHGEAPRAIDASQAADAVIEQLRRNLIAQASS